MSLFTDEYMCGAVIILTVTGILLMDFKERISVTFWQNGTIQFGENVFENVVCQMEGAVFYPMFTNKLIIVIDPMSIIICPSPFATYSVVLDDRMLNNTIRCT